MKNIYNAIQNLYNMDKTTWQEVLAELYNLVSKVENKFDLFELKFGQLLGEEVTRELKKMYDDGSLGSLINDVLLQDINEKVDTFKTEVSEHLDTKANKTDNNNSLNMMRIYRDIVDSNNSKSKIIDNTTPCYIQGMCNINSSIVVYALYNLEKYSNNVILKEVNISENRIIREKTLPLGHANSLTYNPVTNKIYCVMLTNHLDGVETYISKIAVIDYIKLEIVDYITFNDFTVGSVSYDFINNKMYVSDSTNLYELNLINKTTKYVMSYNSLYENATIQHSVVYNNLLYVLYHNPSYISCYNLKGELIKVLNIPTFFGDYFVGEVESFSFTQTNDINTFYLSSIVGDEYGIKYYPQIFKGNINSGYISKSRIYDKFGQYNVYVDKSITTTNPDGTPDNPFNELSEAIIFLKSENIKPNQLVVRNGKHSFAYFKDMKCDVLFQNNASVLGCVIRNSDVSIFSPTFEKSNAIKTGLNVYRNVNLYLDTPTFKDIENTELITNEYSSIFVSGAVDIVNCNYDVVVSNKGSGKINYNNKDTILSVKDVSKSSNGTIKNVSVNLNNTGDLTNFDNGLKYNIINNIYNNIEFICRQGSVLHSVKANLSSLATDTEYPIFLTTYAGESEIYIYKIGVKKQTDGNFIVSSSVKCEHDNTKNTYTNDSGNLIITHMIFS